MNKAHLILFIIVALPFFAAAEPEEQGESQAGYSISSTLEGLYFLDNATGALWHKANGENRWMRIDSPVNRVSDGEKEAASNEPIVLELPEEEVTMPMVQRESRRIPGSSGTLFVELGDITGGQVFVEVVDANGDFIVKRSSLENKEFLKFTVDGKEVFLQIFDMVNNLIGEDICKVRISYTRPVLKTDAESE